MIYCDHHIRRALKNGKFFIDPLPDANQYNSSSVDLRVGDDFHIWKSDLRAGGTSHSIDLDRVELSDLLYLMDRLPISPSGVVSIPPGAFVLVRTLEYVSFPPESKLAGRVEGRSKQARLGLTVHLTAPTIHAGFSGKIALEIVNHGPFEIQVRPNSSRLCQLIIEAVSGVPQRSGGTFSQQSTPLGTPKKNK